jgi:cytochrome P450
MHSIVPVNAKILSEDLVLDNYFVPKDTLIMFCNSYITQSDRFFKNPKKFDPTRWEREDTEINPYSTLAFGFGARMCVGRRVAEQEIYLTIVKILQNYRLEYHETVPDIKIGSLLTPDRPLNIFFHKRN